MSHATASTNRSAADWVCVRFVSMTSRSQNTFLDLTYSILPEYLHEDVCDHEEAHHYSKNHEGSFD